MRYVRTIHRGNGNLCSPFEVVLVSKAKSCELRATFELMYGQPTNVDAVWRDRERQAFMEDRT